MPSDALATDDTDDAEVSDDAGDPEDANGPDGVDVESSDDRDVTDVERNDADAAGVFDLLSDETRVRIVRELYRHPADDSAGSGLSFSELGSRIGIEDTGRFNYHLRRLRGTLVEKRDGRYVLSSLGVAFGRLVVDESAPAAEP